MKTINIFISALCVVIVMMMSTSCDDEKLEMNSSVNFSVEFYGFRHFNNYYVFDVGIGSWSENDAENIEIEDNTLYLIFTDSNTGQEIGYLPQTLYLNPNDGQYGSYQITVSEEGFNHDNVSLRCEARIRVATADYTSEWYDYVSKPTLLGTLRPFTDLGLSVKWCTDDFYDIGEQETGYWTMQSLLNSIDSAPSDISGTQWDPAMYGGDFNSTYYGERRTPTVAEYEDLFNNCTTQVKTDGMYAYVIVTGKNGKSIQFRISDGPAAKTCFWTATFDHMSGKAAAIEFQLSNNKVEHNIVYRDPSDKLFRHAVLNSNN